MWCFGTNLSFFTYTTFDDFEPFKIDVHWGGESYGPPIVRDSLLTHIIERVTRIHSSKSSVFLWLVHLLEDTVKLFHMRLLASVNRFILCQEVQFMWSFIRRFKAVKNRMIGGKRQELLITPVLKSTKGQPNITLHFFILALIYSFIFVCFFLYLLLYLLHLFTIINE